MQRINWGVFSDVSQGSVHGLMLLYILNNDVEEKIKLLLVKVSVDKRIFEGINNDKGRSFT